MQEWMDTEDARDMFLNLMRAWRVVLRTAPYRGTTRRTKLLEGTLAYIVDTVGEHYDFPRMSPSETSISKVAYQVVAESETELLLRIGRKLAAMTEDTFAGEPSQAEYRTTFVGSALAASQMMNAPLGSTCFAGIPEQTSTVALDA